MFTLQNIKTSFAEYYKDSSKMQYISYVILFKQAD